LPLVITFAADLAHEVRVAFQNILINMAKQLLS